MQSGLIARLMALGVLVCTQAGCPEELHDTGIVAHAQIEMFAFPNEVTPSGQVTLLLRVGTDIKCPGDSQSCTLCVGLMPKDGGDSGLLFAAGVTSAGQNLVSLAGLQGEVQIVYRAPSTETSEVVSAAYFPGAVDCARIGGGDAGPPVAPLASGTVRIDVKQPTTGTDAAGETDETVGDAADVGSEAGATDAVGDTSAADGASAESGSDAATVDATTDAGGDHD